MFPKLPTKTTLHNNTGSPQDSNNTPSLSLQAWRLLKSKKKPRRFVGDEFDLDLTCKYIIIIIIFFIVN